ncbi:hypothetical protein Tco_0474268 [Tanacetum coccineum]
MQRPPLLEPNGFCFWKARFETYVKSKDIDLWKVIQNGDFYFKFEDDESQLMKETPYELLKDEKKKQLSKNNEAKMTFTTPYTIRRVCLCSSWILVKYRHRYAVSSLMDTAYWMTEQYSLDFFVKLHNAFLLANLHKLLHI